MIYELTVKDRDFTPIKHTSKVDFLSNGRSIQFKPGVNIIIGPNGSGKSTLIQLMEEYLLLQNTIRSELSDEWYKLPSDLFTDRGRNLKGGILLIADYRFKFFRYVTPSDLLTKRLDMASYSELTDIFWYGDNKSDGEKSLFGLNYILNHMYSDPDKRFPIEDIQNIIKSSNSIWKSRFESLLEYYTVNQVDDKESRLTLLLDEPDKNMDLNNIRHLHKILSKDDLKETQVIAVLHNPILIYKLSELNYVNIIETADGYLDEIKQFINLK